MKEKAYIFMIILTVLISKNINAQDIIYLKSGDKIDRVTHLSRVDFNLIHCHWFMSSTSLNYFI